MKTIVSKSAGFLLLFTLICGIAYTGIITLAAQAIFPSQANGNIIEVDGKIYGSALVGQSFNDPDHLWGRPVTLDASTYKDTDGRPLIYAGPSNLSPASEEYKALITQRTEKIREAHPEMGNALIPVDLVTESASGIDPHISPAAAAYQIGRLANSCDKTIEDVEKIIAQCTNGRFLGLFGEETVNVLKVNLILDGVLK